MDTEVRGGNIGRRMACNTVGGLCTIIFQLSNYHQTVTERFEADVADLSRKLKASLWADEQNQAKQELTKADVRGMQPQSQTKLCFLD